MAQDGFPKTQYVITGKARGGVIQQTRTRAASAVVLARGWMAAGYGAVQIVDPFGNVLSPDRYKIKIMNGGRCYC